MSALMDYLEFFMVYLDSLIIIKSVSFEENLAKFKEVLKQLQPAGIKWNIDYCNFSVSKAEWLGYIIMQQGIKLDPK